MIETLDDVIEDLANKLGIYGAHADLIEGQCGCRVYWASWMKARLLRVVEIEMKLR